eukprot:7348040-Prymnesium_polylepis.1
MPALGGCPRSPFSPFAGVRDARAPALGPSPFSVLRPPFSVPGGGIGGRHLSALGPSPTCCKP